MNVKVVAVDMNDTFLTRDNQYLKVTISLFIKSMFQ